MRGKRARSVEQKAERAARLAEAAKGLWSERRYGAVSVQEIAEAAGVAKGTVFLYYPAKESLGIAVLRDLLRDWWTDLGARLAQLERPGSPSTVAAAVRRSLEGRGAMVELLSITSTVLERNAGREAVVAFRKDLAEGARVLGGHLESVLPFLRRGEGLEMALTLHAVVIGVAHVAPREPEIPMEGAELGPFRVGLPGAVGRTVRIQLEGVRAMSDMTTAPGP